MGKHGLQVQPGRVQMAEARRDVDEHEGLSNSRAQTSSDNPSYDYWLRQHSLRP